MTELPPTPSHAAFQPAGKTARGLESLSFRKRLLISYLCLVLVIPAVSVVIYGASARYADEEAGAFANEALRLVAASLTNRMTAIEQEVFHSEKLYNAASAYAARRAEGGADEAQLTVATVTLQSHLFDIMYADQAFSAIYYIDSDGRMISCRRASFQSDGATLMGIDLRAETKRLKAARGRAVWEPFDDKYVALRKLVYNMNTLAPEGSVCILIARDVFVQPYDNQKMACAMLAEDGRVLLAQGVGASEAAETYLREGSARVTVDGASYLCETVSDERWRGRMVLMRNMASVNASRALFTLLLTLSLAGAAGLSLCLSIFFSHRMGREMKTLLSGMERIGAGDLSTPIVMQSRDELNLLASGVNDMQRHIRQLMDTVLVEQRLKQRAEYQALEYRYYALQCQIHPHLLFNTLESINGVAKLNGDFECSRLICRLARLLRQTLDETRVFTPLSGELAYLTDYLDFYRRVYGERLTVTLHADAEVQDFPVPSFILVPIVENAIVHGVEKTTAPVNVSVLCRAEEERVCLEVENDGPPMDAALIARLREDANAAPSDGRRARIGLRSVRERLALLYGNDAEMRVSCENGTLVELYLPRGGVWPVERGEGQP